LAHYWHKKESLDFLNKVREGKILDEERALTEVVLQNLYPHQMTSDEAIRFMPDVCKKHKRSYSIFWYNLPAQIPVGDLLKFIYMFRDDREIITCLKAVDKYAVAKFLGALILRYLDELQADMTVSVTLDVLKTPLDEYQHSILESEEKEKIGKWFEKNYDTFIEVYLELIRNPIRQDKPISPDWGIREMCCFYKGKVELAVKLLDVAAAYPETDLGEFAFTAALRCNWQEVETLADFVAISKAYSSQYFQGKDGPHEVVPDWRIKNARSSIKGALNKKNAREKNIQFFAQEARVQDVRILASTKAVSFIARAYLGSLSGSDVRYSIENIEEVAGSAIAHEFREVALDPVRIQFIPLEDILDSNATGNYFNQEESVTSACTLLLEEGQEDTLHSLDDASKLSCIAYNFLGHLGRSEDAFSWFAKYYPEQCLLVLCLWWQKNLAVKRRVLTHIPAIEQAHVAEIAKKFARKELSAQALPFRKLMQLLELLFQEENYPSLTAFVKQIIPTYRDRKGPTILLWGAMLACGDDAHLPEFVEALKKKGVFRDIFVEVAESHWRKGKVQVSYLSEQALGTIAGVFITTLQPFEKKDSFVTTLEQAHNLTGRLIQLLGARLTDEATKALDMLLVLAKGTDWSNRVRQVRAEHLKKKSEQKFKAPTVEEITKTLVDFVPSSPQALQDYMLAKLEELNLKIQTSPANLHHQFWNISPRQGSGTKTPRSEEFCRDAILSMLEPDIKKIMGLHLDKEVVHVNETRADLCLKVDRYKLPVEIKRQNHPAIWTSVGGQLISQYCTAPDTQGYGIYLGLWFGADEEATPYMRVRPQSFKEFEAMLCQAVPDSHRDKVKSVALDCSLPLTKRGKA
jgi:hypothetical protein